MSANKSHNITVNQQDFPEKTGAGSRIYSQNLTRNKTKRNTKK